MTIEEHTEKAIRAMVAEDAIRRVMLRYCRGVDRGDAALITSAYHPDAVDHHGSSSFTGTTVGDGILAMMPDCRTSSHNITNMLIELDDADHAGCETYFTVWQTLERDGEEHILHALGRYVDRMERRDGAWRIATRLVVVELTYLIGPGQLVAPSNAGLGRRDRSDPSYAVLP